MTGMTNASPRNGHPSQASTSGDGTAQPGTPRTAVIHDGNGTWFGVDELWMSLLTDSELADLEAGDESTLDRVPCVNLLIQNG